MLKCTCNPSPAAGGRDTVCCAPLQTTLLVKNVRFEKMAQKLKKIRHATLPTLAAQISFPGINFGIALHHFYREISAALISLYIVLTATLRLHLVFVDPTLH